VEQRAIQSKGITVLTKAATRFAAWLSDNRTTFSFKRDSHALRQLALLKPFAEYVLCNEVVLSFHAQEGCFADNLRWAWSEIEQGDFLTRLLLARPDVFTVASLYAPLCRQGYRNERLETVLREVSQLRSTKAAEMQAWMRLGFRHAMSQIQGEPYDPEGAGKTWLLEMPEPWCINDEIMYSITHEVFYAADFGRLSCRFPDEIIRYLELWVPVWARYYVREKNWDLVAELTMVADCLGDFVWDNDPLPTLIAQQTGDGHIPGPVGAGALLMSGSETKEQAGFFGIYHTTLVSAMAVALRQRPSVGTRASA
jgi:hypothetical protein